MADVSTLRGVPFLAVLPPAELEALARQAHPRHYRAGTTIFHREDPGSTLHVIRKGRVKLTLASPEGREVTVGLLGPGDFFGELALLDGGPRSASVVALEPVETLTIDRGPFLDTLESHPEVAGALLAVLGERLRNTDELIQDILFLDLPARLAKRLLDLAEDHGQRVEEVVRIDVRLNQSELAGIVGSTRESVTVRLNALRRAGIIDFVDRKILIKTPAATAAV